MLRSLLFLPGNSPAMLLNGMVLPADAIIIDLEDAVAPDQKDAARDLVAQALKTLDFGTRQLLVRINALDTPYWREDVATVVKAGARILMPAKVSGAEYIQTLDEELSRVEEAQGLEQGSVRILALIETAQGIEEAPAIAKASSRLIGLFLGAEDLSADLGAERTKEGKEIFYARSRIVASAKAAGILAIDTPFTDVHDQEGLVADTRLARNMGFTGKASISPHHLKTINQVFAPTPEAILYAQEVMAVIEEGKRQGKGAVSLHGKMVDPPIVARAQKVLQMAQELGLLADPSKQDTAKEAKEVR